MTISGAGGDSKNRGPSNRTPRITPDSLDSRQYANVIDLISEGEIEGLANGNRSVFLNDTPLQNLDGTFNFEDVEIHSRMGSAVQEKIAIIRGSENDRQINRPVTRLVPVVETVTDPTLDAVKVTISVPSLQSIDSGSGDTNGTSVRLKIFTDYGQTGTYSEIIDDTISGRTADLYQKDYELRLTSATRPVSIKVERMTPDSTDSLLTNSFTWSTLTEIQYEAQTYPNSALIGLRVDAEQFSSVPKRKYLVKGIKVKVPAGVTIDSNTGRIIYPENFVWNGQFEDNGATKRWTSCPAWLLYHLLLDSRMGLGDHIDESQLDRYAFYSASKYANELVADANGTPNAEARFSCNTTIQTAEEAFKVISDLLSVMRCQGFYSAGSMTISQDAPRDPTYLFTAANVTEEGFNYSGGSLKTKPTVVVVAYLDLDLKDIAYEVVQDDDAVARYGVIRREVSAFACTSRGQAARIAKWVLYTEKYERSVVGFSSGLEAGQTIRPGQVIMISDPAVAGSRLAGRIKSSTIDTVTVDNTEDTDLTYGGGSKLSVILPDGTAEERPLSSNQPRFFDQAGYANEGYVIENVLAIVGTFSVAPNPNSIWMIEKLGLGSGNVQPSTWQILGIEEKDDQTYGISAVSYNASKYAHIEDGEVLVSRDLTNLDEIPAKPTDLAILDVPLVGGGTTRELKYVINGRIAIKITFHWAAAKGIKKFRVRWRHQDDNFTETEVQGTTFDLHDVKNGTYHIQVSSISGTKLQYSEPTIANYSVLGLGDTPADIKDLSLVPITETLGILSWKKVPDLDVLMNGRIVIRHDPRISGSATWLTSNKIIDGVSGASTQKQVPLLGGTYFVKAEDYLGNRSENAAQFVATLPQINSMRLTVKTWSEETAFSGTKVNTALAKVGNDLVLSPSVYVSTGYCEPFYFDGDEKGEYTFASTFDFGHAGVQYDAVLRKEVVSRVLDNTGSLWDVAAGNFDDYAGYFDGASAEADGNIDMFVRTTPDDPSGSPTWGEWAEFEAAIIRGRGIQIKASVEINSSRFNLSVSDLGATLVLLDRTESAAIASGASASTGIYNVTFASAFYQTPQVAITPNTSSSNLFSNITNLTRTGFTVTFTDGTVTDTAFMYTASGYGQAI